MKKLQPPQPNAHLSKLERYGSAELLGIFETCLRTGSTISVIDPLAVAWGRLFSELFLSAEELVDEIQQGEGRFSNDHEQMLRDFIRMDCARGGSFVFKVIRNGGKIDRAALFMIADLDDLAGIKRDGVMAIQMLLDACDKKVRPALIKMAGRHLLSQVYDRRDLPLIFTIFGLCDLGGDDLDAIDAVFSKEDLKRIMSKSRTGKNALEVYTGVAESMKRYPPMERNASLVRNAFYITAEKDTKTAREKRPVRIRKVSHMPKRDSTE